MHKLVFKNIHIQEERLDQEIKKNSVSHLIHLLCHLNEIVNDYSSWQSPTEQVFAFCFALIKSILQSLQYKQLFLRKSLANTESEYFLPLIYMATIQTFNMSIKNKIKICSHPQRQWHASEYYVYMFLYVSLSKIAFIFFSWI